MGATAGWGGPASVATPSAPGHMEPLPPHTIMDLAGVRHQLAMGRAASSRFSLTPRHQDHLKGGGPQGVNPSPKPTSKPV